MSSQLKLVFAGSPSAAVPSLTALLQSHHSVEAVISRADSRQGRKGILTPTPVAAAAEEAGIPVIKANKLDESVTREVAAIEPDLGVIVAYGGLVREPLLSTPRLGWINLHFSVLPRWRGAAPVQRAIIAGDQSSGASVFQLVPELDAGDVFATEHTPIGALQTAGHLLDSLAVSGADLLVRVVTSLADGTAIARPQEGEPTFAPKVTLDDGSIDWNVDAATAFNRIRGVTPEPGAHTMLDGGRFKIHEARIAHGSPRIPSGELRFEGRSVLMGTASQPLELLVVQPAGKKAMNAADWWRGRPAQSATVAGA